MIEVTSNDALSIFYILTGLSSVIAAIGSAVSAVLASRNSRKLDEVHKATNGMTEALVKTTGQKMFARGVLRGEDFPRSRKQLEDKKPVVKKKRSKNV